MKNKIIIRAMIESDSRDLDKWFGQSSIYGKKPGHWVKYIKESKGGKRVAVVAEIKGKLVGFCTLKFISNYSHFKNNRIPEINDMIVAEPFLNQGVGERLVSYLEKIAKKNGYKKVGIGVGLYADYGAAQRLYVKMGYVPDGQGVMYKDVAVVPGKKYRLDDDLLLYLIKI